MFTLPALTSDISVAVTSAVKSNPVSRCIEPIGKSFYDHAQRTLRNLTWSEFEKIQSEKNTQQVEDLNVDPDELLFDDDITDKSLLSLEAKNWKSADLYAAMGLSKLRYKASPAQILKAYRRQVLKHHPDKQSAAGVSLDEDNLFKIIQKAFEILTDETKKAQYDSCDFNSDVQPPKKGLEYDFYEAWTPVFDAEARFSKKTPVPPLGSAESTREEVEKFYSFWHRFDSWRSFEFLDEEVPDDSSNRDHKRYVEKKNTVARNKKKTADNARLSKLVDRAMSEDPRIKLLKDQEKKERERKKQDKESGTRAEAEARAKLEAEAKAKAEIEASAAAAVRADKKKVKELAKAARKKNKRAIRLAPKENHYFGDSDKATIIDDQVGLIVDSLDDEQLANMAEIIKNDAKNAFIEMSKTLIGSGKLPATLVSYFL